MTPDASFNQQFFAISRPTTDRRVLLAGGIHPLSGSRSAYRSSVACYDYAQRMVVWLHEQSKNYPFRAVSHVGGVCAAMLPQNFVRCPTGMFRFDLESGEPIQPDFTVRGWKIESIDAWAETFIFSWVCEEKSFVRAVEARGAACRERSFPYHSTSGGKTIERVIATGEETVVAIFSVADGRRVVQTVESWSWKSESPNWEKRTTLKNAVRNDSVLLLWQGAGPNLEVEILSIESGDESSSFRLALADVVSIQPIGADSYAVLTFAGAFILDTAAKTLAQVIKMGVSDFLDFGALAVDSSLGKLVVITAGNHQRPGTRLMVVDL